MAGRSLTLGRAGLAACIVLTGCGGGAGRTVSPGGSATTATPSPAVAIHAVGTTVETFTDPSRQTPEHGTIPARPSRTLRTTIVYPAATDGGPPDVAGAPYPLIVFTHGSGGFGPSYLPLLRSWAAAGYVVAAPQLPVAAEQPDGAPESAGDSASVVDLPNHPADVSFVITSLLRLNDDAASALHGRIDPARIGAAGHSLGAMATLALAANTCCYDSRVKAAVILAGREFPIGGGTFYARIRTPVLFVHGDADDSVAYRDGKKAYDDAPPPRFLVTLLGGKHSSMYDPFEGAAARVTVKVTRDFLDAYLRGPAASSVAQLRGDGTAAGVAKVDSEV